MLSQKKKKWQKKKNKFVMNTEKYSYCINFYHSLWANSADDKLMMFSYFSQKTGSDISCKLSPLETICMKCQNQFSGKNKKNISICHLLKILYRVLSINQKVNLPILTREKIYPQKTLYSHKNAVSKELVAQKKVKNKFVINTEKYSINYLTPSLMVKMQRDMTTSAFNQCSNVSY